jgi:hypothetical protein
MTDPREFNRPADRLEQVLKVASSARRNGKDMNVWADDVKAMQDAVTALRTAAAASSAGPVKVKVLNWQHDGNQSYAYCDVTETRWTARNTQERKAAEARREARILSALIPEPAKAGDAVLLREALVNGAHYLGAIRQRLEQLYEEHPENPRLREQVSDEVDFIDGLFESLSTAQPDTAAQGGKQSDGGVEGHAEFASGGKSRAMEATDHRESCAETLGDPEALCSNSPEATGAGIKPGPSDPTPSRPEVSVAELAYWFAYEMPVDESSSDKARALKAKYHMEGRE